MPNFAYVIGYTNASWTLKADLVSEYVCRLLALMRRRGYDTVVPERDPSVSEEPFMDFSSGYVQRSLHLLPKQGSRAPWRLRMNYLRDLVTIRRGRLEHESLRFSRSRSPGRLVSGIAQTPEPPYVAVVFTSLRTEGTTGTTVMSARMEELAARQPGYLGIESARDGLGITRVLLGRRGVRPGLEAGRGAPRRAASAAGTTWYSDYRVRVRGSAG